MVRVVPGKHAVAVAVEAVAWVSVVMRVAQFLLWSESPVTVRATFAVLAVLLAAVALVGGLRLS